MDKSLKEQIRDLEEGRGGREAVRNAFNTAQSGMKALEDATNAMGSDVEAGAVAGIVAGLDNMHRHLQAKMVFALLKALGELPRVGRSDGRNAHAHRACDKLREALKDQVYWA